MGAIGQPSTDGTQHESQKSIWVFPGRDVIWQKKAELW
jgi:hypothetical protein